MKVKLVIPGNPLSVNHLYGVHGKRRFLYKAGKIYKTLVATIAKTEFKKPLENNNVCMEIRYYFPDNRRRDVTNYDKSPIDALSGIAFKDDSQIQECMLKKYVDKSNPRTEIDIFVKE